ncbi:MAG: AAA family ATPase, partial [Isosphaeraceae bacterium]
MFGGSVVVRPRRIVGALRACQPHRNDSWTYRGEGIAMARIISVANQKGGVGKTTSAINIAAGLAKSGRSALVVDI